MTIGKEGVEQARVHSLEETKAILDVFQKYGHNEIDTARVSMPKDIPSTLPDEEAE